MPRALVIAPQWIGDAVMAQPLMGRLAARGERLTVAALPSVAPVFAAMPEVAETIALPFARGAVQLKARHALAKEWQGRFDCAYVLPNSLKSALLPFLAGVPRRVGYLGEARLGLITHRVRKPRRRRPMVAHYSALSGATEGLEHDRPQLSLPPDRLAQVLAPHGLKPGGYLVLAPGAEYGPAKRWPAGHYATLAQALPLRMVLLGSAKEAALAAQIALAAPPGRCLNLAGQTTLDEALALIAGACGMVSNDSGLMHVAAAFGLPQVAVFGSSSPLHTPPLNPRARVVWLKDDPRYQPPLNCAPCFKRECPLGHTRCLVDLSPARVLQELELARQSPPALVADLA